MARGRTRSAAAAAPTGTRRANAQIPFAHKLILNQWLLSLFNVKRFEDLAEPVRNEALDGLDENNVHHFHHALTAQLFNLTQLPTELLLEYDQNIVKHILVAIQATHLRARQAELLGRCGGVLDLKFRGAVADSLAQLGAMRCAGR